MSQTILFLCLHGAAKSILAAAYMEQLAAMHDLDVQVSSGGTEPDEHVSPGVAELLRAEGIDIGNRKPRGVTEADLENASVIVSLGCPVGAMDVPEERIIHWDDVPSPSQDLAASSKAIRAHVEQLLAEMRADKG